MATRKNVTFSAPAETIERARLRAQSERTTLNEAFRAWLNRYSAGQPSGEDLDRWIKRLKHVDAGRKFNRNETAAREPRR